MKNERWIPEYLGSSPQKHKILTKCESVYSVSDNRDSRVSVAVEQELQVFAEYQGHRHRRPLNEVPLPYLTVDVDGPNPVLR